MVYCDNLAVKSRCLIDASDANYDSAISDACNEASRVVDLFLKPYVDTPLTGDNLTATVADIAADFGASILKRRLFPTEVKMEGQIPPIEGMKVEASGWWGLAISKLREYIRSSYTLAQVVGNSIYNPQIHMRLLKEGLITPLEARKFVGEANTVYQTEIDSISKTLTENVTQTKTLLQTDTVTKDILETRNRKNKRMVFTNSDSDGCGYEAQGGD